MSFMSFSGEGATLRQTPHVVNDGMVCIVGSNAGVEVQSAISEFVAYYNHERLNESLNNRIPADVNFDRAKEVKIRRERYRQAKADTYRVIYAPAGVTSFLPPVNAGHSSGRSGVAKLTGPVILL